MLIARPGPDAGPAVRHAPTGRPVSGRRSPTAERSDPSPARAERLGDRASVSAAIPADPLIDLAWRAALECFRIRVDDPLATEPDGRVRAVDDAMAITYYKRFRMEIDLDGSIAPPPLPRPFIWVPWDESLIDRPRRGQVPELPRRDRRRTSSPAWATATAASG